MGMQTRRVQITVREDVAERWESDAAQAGVSLSSWIVQQVANAQVGQAVAELVSQTDSIADDIDFLIGELLPDTRKRR